jgi:V/A-type H+-transporting ATPase subunit E
MARDGEKKIIDKIITMAEEESTKITAEAQKKAGEIKKEAALNADTEARDIINHGKQEAQREQQRIIADARLKAKRKKMSMQEKLMQESFEHAMKYLQTLMEKGEDADYNYTAIITRFITEAAEIIGDQTLSLTFNEKDKQKFQPLLSKLNENVSQRLGKKVSLSIDEKSLPTLGGVNVKSMETAVGVDNTIESRMSRFNEKLKAEVTKILFQN